jgi:cytochrome c peroxidase
MTVGRREIVYVVVITLLLGIVGLFWWQRGSMLEEKTPEEAPLPPPVAARISEPIQPIPKVLNLNPKKVALGEKLFHEPLLSGDGTVSCASCHNLATGGVDRKQRSSGINGALGRINTPTVFNSGFHSKLFWDGRVETLEAQIDGPLMTEHEMGSTWESVIANLERSESYRQAFAALYPDGINENAVKDAISTFERSLYTPNSRFDRFLRGDDTAITEDEKAGYGLFKTYGCVKCHQGITVGGNHFDTFGAIGDYFADRGNITKEDFGRFNVTGDERDRYKFKVCSLRNVVLTPPYFHDGSAATLEEAVSIMARYQLGRHISETDLNLIVKFLATLTGEYKGQPL